MSLPASPPSAPPHPRSNSWTTPRLLQTGLIAAFVVAVLFFCAALAAIRATDDRVQTIGKDAVPSILAAEKLKVALADLDANVVNELIVPPGQSADSIKGYVARRQEITENLVTAAQNITYGDLERKPIVYLTDSLSAYERLAIKARTLRQHGDDRGATATYRDALTQLQQSLYPAADALAKANSDALIRRDAELSAQTQVTAGLAVATGGALIVLLIVLQLLLVTRTRRLLNPALVMASIVSLGLLIGVTQSCQNAEGQIRVARDDAFASLSALWQARVASYDANSDESRWLFDQERRPDLEKSFFTKAALLLAPPGGTGYDSVTQVAANPTALPSGTKGFLPDEMHNVTFPGEGAAAQTVIQAWGIYYATDAKLRSLENSGQHAEAVRFDIGMGPGDSNYAYSQYDDAMQKTIDINQSYFDDAVDSGFRALRWSNVGLPVTVLIIGALCFLGIRPRLREYDI